MSKEEKAYLMGDIFSDDDRYKKTIDTIYEKLKPIWIAECKDALWLMKDEFIKDVAKIIYMDDKLGGNLDPSTLAPDMQNLLGWKQVQNVVEKYNAMNFSLVDAETTKAILSSIIKDKNARDADRLKAIEMYNEMYSGEGIEGVTFINDISGRLKARKEERADDDRRR